MNRKTPEIAIVHVRSVVRAQAWEEKWKIRSEFVQLALSKGVAQHARWRAACECYLKNCFQFQRRLTVNYLHSVLSSLLCS